MKEKAKNKSKSNYVRIHKDNFQIYLMAFIVSQVLNYLALLDLI